MSAAENVIILPVIRIERDAGVPVQGRVSQRTKDALQRLANDECGGDLSRCVSDLLEHCADVLEGEGR